MAKIITTIRFEEGGEDPRTDVTITMGVAEDFDGDLVIKQGSDTVVVSAAEAINFAEALLKYVNSDG